MSRGIIDQIVYNYGGFGECILTLPLNQTGDELRVYILLKSLKIDLTAEKSVQIKVDFKYWLDNATYFTQDLIYHVPFEFTGDYYLLTVESLSDELYSKALEAFKTNVKQSNTALKLWTEVINREL